jgi:arylsulfatase A-like enzyme
MLVKWPGVTGSNSVCTRPVIVEDFLPSILEMAGVAAPLPVDGLSFVPLLRDCNRPGTSRERQLFWHYPNVWGPQGPGIEPFSAIREGDWKLIYYHAGPRYELFNLSRDISERQNMLETQAAKAHELAVALAAWLRETQAQMPVNRQSGKAVGLPTL